VFTLGHGVTARYCKKYANKGGEYADPECSQDYFAKTRVEHLSVCSETELPLHPTIEASFQEAVENDYSQWYGEEEREPKPHRPPIYGAEDVLTLMRFEKFLHRSVSFTRYPSPAVQLT